MKINKEKEEIFERMAKLTDAIGKCKSIKDNSTARQVKIADLEDNIKDLEEGSLKDKYRLALYILSREGIHGREGD